MPRGTAHRDFGDRAVGVECHVQQQVAGEVPPPGLARIIEVADAFDLGAPGIHVGGVFVFLRARVQELVARALLEFLPGAADLGVEARAFLLDLRARHQAQGRRLQLQLLFVRPAFLFPDLAGFALRQERGFFAHRVHALARHGLERGEIAVHGTDLAHRQRVLGDLLGIAVAATVLVRLRQKLRVLRTLVARRLHQRDLECRQPGQVAQPGQGEGHAQDHHHVHQERAEHGHAEAIGLGNA